MDNGPTLPTNHKGQRLKVNKVEFRTIVDIPKPDFEIGPCDEVLFVGSCFADAIGRRFCEEAFPTTVNPYGTMYNPVSVLHTIERCEAAPNVAFLTLGTNHVYRLKETGEIVDNCAKRPAAIFQEEQLSVSACADALRTAIRILQQRNAAVKVVLTVSPIRYRKYGYHESQLSKATLLLTIDKVLEESSKTSYFPAYEIVMDELRDYRFYAADMLHPSEQAADYIWERLVDAYFSAEAKAFLQEWRPLRQALAHRPFDPDSADYKALIVQTMLKVDALRERFPKLVVPSRYELHH